MQSLTLREREKRYQFFGLQVRSAKWRSDDGSPLDMWVPGPRDRRRKVMNPVWVSFTDALTLALVAWNQLVSETTGMPLSPVATKRWLTQVSSMYTPNGVLALLKGADDLWTAWMSSGRLFTSDFDSFKREYKAKVGQGKWVVLDLLTPLIKRVFRGNPDYQLIRSCRIGLSFLRKVTITRKNEEWALEAERKFIAYDRALPELVTADESLVQMLEVFFTENFAQMARPRQEEFCHGNGATYQTTRDDLVGKWASFKSDPILRIAAEQLGIDLGIPAVTNEGKLYFIQPDDGLVRVLKLCTVPKDCTRYRTIGKEQAILQWWQHGCAETVWRTISSGWLGRHISQRENGARNAELARIGSITGKFATIDLSMASDGVYWPLLQRVTSKCPTLSLMLEASRATHADLEHYGRYELNKFAGMGSALTFPVECILFAGITCLAIQLYGDDPKRSGFAVHGDDIVIEQRYVESVLRLLEMFGFIPNTEKSYYLGQPHEGPFTRPHSIRPVYGIFRESCGAEWLDGVDMSCPRLPRPFQGFSWGFSAQGLDSCSSWPAQTISLANRFLDTEVSEVRAFLVRRLLEAPEELRPMFSDGGYIGLDCHNPTNFHLKRGDPPIYGGTRISRRKWCKRGYTSPYYVHGTIKTAMREPRNFVFTVGPQKYRYRFASITEGVALYENLRSKFLATRWEDEGDSLSHSTSDSEYEFDMLLTHCWSLAGRRSSGVRWQRTISLGPD